jgi:hypothetical protein
MPIVVTTGHSSLRLAAAAQGVESTEVVYDGPSFWAWRLLQVPRFG